MCFEHNKQKFVEMVVCATCSGLMSTNILLDKKTESDAPKSGGKLGNEIVLSPTMGTQKKIVVPWRSQLWLLLASIYIP